MENWRLKGCKCECASESESESGIVIGISVLYGYSYCVSDRRRIWAESPRASILLRADTIRN